MSEVPSAPSKADTPVERWLKAAAVALFVALAPLRLVAGIFDFDVPIWIHGVLFVVITVVLAVALRDEAQSAGD